MSSPGDRPPDPPGQAPGLRGPKGEAGEAGAAGSRGGLSRVQGRAIMVLFLIGALGGAGNLLWTSHSVNVSAAAQQRLIADLRQQAAAEQAKWCSLLVTLDRADAAAPKKPTPGTFTAAFAAEVRQLRDLECKGVKP